MARVILVAVLMLVIARVFWRVVEGVVQGMGGTMRRPGPAGPPARGVQMVRDPVCGTFVVPERAVALGGDGERLYFCSTRCRDQFRARSA